MSPKTFKVDARAMLTWGRDSIKDHTTAVLELVKNSYDAGATIVEVDVHAAGKTSDRYIRISDNGCGMSDQDIDEYWLRIGYSHKLDDKYSRGKRRKTGEKGIGRISADRLGRVLELRTQAKDHEAVGLRIDWHEFETSGKDISQVAIPVLDAVTFSVPRPSTYDTTAAVYHQTPEPLQNSSAITGTELTIRGMRHEWASDDVDALHRELSLLTSPFGSVKDFQIRMESDLSPTLAGVISSAFYETAEVDAEFLYSNGTEVSYVLKDRDDKGNLRVAETDRVRWLQFIHKEQSKDTDTNKDTETDKAPIPESPRFGPVKVRLLFYPRKSETVRGTDLSVSDLREFLDINAGIKVYRDDVRVMPYGSPGRPEGDWLGLGDRKARNPAGAGRADFQVGPDQIVGAVFLSRDDNPAIIDTSGREGLIHSDQFYELRAFLYGCLAMLEAHYHKLYIARQKELEKDLESPRVTVDRVNEDLKRLIDTLKCAESQLPARASRTIERVKNQISETSNKLQHLQKSSEDLASQATIYRGLASLGIASATFAHETESCIESFLSSAYTAKTLIGADKQHRGEVSEELDKAIRSAERVAAWGAFALSRVRRDKRQRRVTNITELAATLIKELRPIFEASEIKLVENLAMVKGRTFPMDVESVLLNLLANAYYFAKLNNRKRHVVVSLMAKKQDGENGFEIIVSDTGPGVRPTIRDVIWKPLFSTKIDKKGRPFGTGLGLSIVDSVVKDLSGSKSVDADDKLGGACFRIWLSLP